MLTYIFIAYAAVSLIWACYSIYMFFGLEYHKNKTLGYIVMHVSLTFIVNLCLFPISLYVANRKKILTPKQWRENTK